MIVLDPTPDLEKNLYLTILNLIDELPYLDTSEEICQSAKAIESLTNALVNLRSQPFTPPPPTAIARDRGRDKVIPFPVEPEPKPKRRRKPGQPTVTRKSKAIASSASPIDSVKDREPFPPFDPRTGLRVFDSQDREPDYPDFVRKAIDKSPEGNYLVEMIASLQKEIQSLKSPAIEAPVPVSEPPKEPEPIAFYSWDDGQVAGKEYYSPSSNTVAGLPQPTQSIPREEDSDTNYPDFWNP